MRMRVSSLQVAWLIALALLVLSHQPLRAQQPLYTITTAGQLYSVDLFTGAATAKMPGAAGMNAIGLAFYNGFAVTYDNNVAGFQLLNPTTGQVVGSPILVSGIGPYTADGDFCFAADGSGYFADAGFVPAIRKFSLSTGTSSALPTMGIVPALRGLTGDPTNPNRLYGMDGDGNLFTITNIPGVSIIAQISGTFPLRSFFGAKFTNGGLAMSAGNNLFCIDNSNVNTGGGAYPTSLRPVNPTTGAIGPNLNVVVTTMSGVTFGGGVPAGPGPGPAPGPAPGPGGGEGSFPGFSFRGGQRLAPNPNPILAGPVHLNPEGDVIVCNFARVSAAEPSGSSTTGVVGGAMFVTLAGAGMVLAWRRWR